MGSSKLYAIYTRYPSGYTSHGPINFREGEAKQIVARLTEHTQIFNTKLEYWYE